MAPIKDSQVVNWLVPGILSLSLCVLGWMAININRISEAVAVMAYKNSDQDAHLGRHDRQIDMLAICCQTKGRPPLESHP